jgi:hypothetical protein
MAKRAPLLTLVMIINLYTFGQAQKYFEGKIIYKFSFKADKVPFPDKLLNTVFGYGSTLYFKEGNYRHEYEGGLLEFDLYIKADNKFYQKKRNNDTIFWSDCSIAKDKIQNLLFSSKGDTILGVICDRLLIQYKDNSEIHYYNSDSIRINPAWFENFKLNDEYLIDRKEKSIYLKNEQSFANFILIESATKISAEAIDVEKFKLPANLILIQQQ